MSKIEQLISDIEAYIDECKFVKFSSTKIVVDKEVLEEKLRQLRLSIPNEIQKYKKIVESKEAILGDAREQSARMLKNAKTQAENIIDQAQIQTAELISEHEVMQQAYNQADMVKEQAKNEANQLIEQSNQRAQFIMGRAEQNAYEIRAGAIDYTDEMLSKLQDIIGHSINANKHHYEVLIRELEAVLSVVENNRNELKGDSDNEKSVQVSQNFEEPSADTESMENAQDTSSEMENES